MKSSSDGTSADAARVHAGADQRSCPTPEATPEADAGSDAADGTAACPVDHGRKRSADHAAAGARAAGNRRNGNGQARLGAWRQEPRPRRPAG